MADTQDVFEVYGSNASGMGYDFIVCTSLQEALIILEGDLDALDNGDEVKVIYRKYTKEQMGEVIYE